jgi:hypothetical protein
VSWCMGGRIAWRIQLRATPCFRLGPGPKLEALLLCNGASGLGQGRKRPVWRGGLPKMINYLKDYTQGLEEALNATKMRMAEIEKARKVE